MTTLYKYLANELTRGYVLENDEAKYTEKRERVYTFVKIPREVEKFMFYGFFQCVDSFLFIFTFLPLRFLLALLKILTHPCGVVIKGSRRVLEPAQIIDILKVLIILCVTTVLTYVDLSMMYHIIRGQAVIKLYIFYNMLEVADRLFSSFGQDILDALFWTATEPRNRRREHVGVLPHLLLGMVYVFLHGILVLFQATTLNVAFNSHNKALLTIMMSNNFVELKGSVFKKFEKNNLFQMSCSDVRERFHMYMLMFIVLVRNMTEFSWKMDHLMELLPDVAAVLLAEFLVDWVKHAFITKFNEISTEVYRDYTVSLAYDLLQSRQKNAYSDHADLVSRRMGFIPLPLACLLVRIVIQLWNISGYFCIIIIILFYLCLCTSKIMIGIFLMARAITLVDSKKKDDLLKSPVKQATAPVPGPLVTETRRSSNESISFSEPLRPKPSLKKSKSISDVMDLETENTEIRRRLTQNVTFCELESKFHKDSLSNDIDPGSPGIGDLERAPSMLSKPMLSNSSVSLNSIGLNEEFLNDCGANDVTDTSIVKDDSSIKFNSSLDSEVESIQRTLPEDPMYIYKKKYPEKPLSDVERYTLCSNRIV
ncbi:unnamed protein product [Owenia fusiformis]|uniref:Uncharacterized protein n=1 Tax=Owenia fusiformis TaxID=6347 RepID=A0A8J1XGL3_OWEFU|nr:unnamed protein product [Owenia fusiformis]